MVFPLAAELENVEQLLDGELGHDRGRLAMTAFGEEVQAWNDETSFEEAPGIEDLAVESFIPTGTFTDEGELPEARALLTGIVEQPRTLRNEATGRPFIHAMVSTYEMTIDCVFAPQDVPTSLSPGSVVQGSFWLMGRLLPA